MLAQETSNPFGKIYRLNEDGTEPSDNPFVGKGIKGIWSLGHRNPQGLTIDLNGDLWDTEHGPRGGDEVNRIEKGVNYGWPVIAFSINYNDAPNWSPWASRAPGSACPHSAGSLRSGHVVSIRCGAALSLRGKAIWLPVACLGRMWTGCG